MNVKITAFFIVFSLTLSHAGCAMETLSDLKVTSIDKVNRSELREIIGDDANLPLVELWASNDDFLKLELSTKENLAHYIRKTKFTMFVNMSFCDAPKDVVLLGIPNVYIKRRNVFMLRLFDVPEKDKFELSDDGLFVYDIVLFAEWSKERELPAALRKNKDQFFYLQYDLKETPSAICLSLGGGDMLRSYPLMK